MPTIISTFTVVPEAPVGVGDIAMLGLKRTLLACTTKFDRHVELVFPARRRVAVISAP